MALMRFVCWCSLAMLAVAAEEEDFDIARKPADEVDARSAEALRQQLREARTTEGVLAALAAAEKAKARAVIKDLAAMIAGPNFLRTDRRVREASYRAAAACGGADALQPLVAAAAMEPDLALVDVIGMCVRQIDSERGAALAKTGLAAAKNEHQQHRLLMLLGYTGRFGIEVLQRHARSADPVVRETVAMAAMLAKSLDTVEAAALLKELAADPDEGVRLAAAHEPPRAQKGDYAPEKTPEKPPLPDVDLVLIVDASSSMREYQFNIVKFIEETAKHLKSRARSLRIGLVSYKMEYDEIQIAPLSFNTQRKLFSRQGIWFSGGSGDLTGALNHAMQRTTFRAGAQRIFYLVCDQGSLERASDGTLSTAAMIPVVTGARLHATYAPENSPSRRRELEKICKAGGGEFCPSSAMNFPMFPDWDAWIKANHR